MSNLQFTGTIHLIGETKQITDTFSKREFVVTDGAEQYAKFINFELIKDNVDLVNGLKVGQEITVSFNLDGRIWTNPQGEDKFFNSLKAWKIEPVGNAPAPQTKAPTKVDESDSLPF